VYCAEAMPKKILALMGVSGLTRDNIASHLQKYRLLFLKRLTPTQGGAQGLPMGATGLVDHKGKVASAPDQQVRAHQGRFPAQRSAVQCSEALSPRRGPRTLAGPHRARRTCGARLTGGGVVSQMDALHVPGFAHDGGGNGMAGNPMMGQMHHHPAQLGMGMGMGMGQSLDSNTLLKAMAESSRLLGGLGGLNAMVPGGMPAYMPQGFIPNQQLQFDPRVRPAPPLQCNFIQSPLILLFPSFPLALCCRPTPSQRPNPSIHDPADETFHKCGETCRMRHTHTLTRRRRQRWIGTGSARAQRHVHAHDQRGDHAGVLQRGRAEGPRSWLQCVGAGEHLW